MSFVHARLLALHGFVTVVAVLGVAACGGGSPGPVEPAAPTTGGAVQEDSPEAVEEGSALDILADEPTSVLLDGKPIGKAPITGYKVEPGSHDVTFVDERRGNRTMVVKVGPNETQTVKADNPPTRFVAPGEDQGGKAE